MEQLDLNKILNREIYIERIQAFLHENNETINSSKGLYIYGPPGNGKTTFVVKLLEKLNYDVMYFNCSDIRNKNFLLDLSTQNANKYSVLSLFTKKIKPLIIVMDDINTMNNGDKGSLSQLIKLIRKKKTKKQNNEEKTEIPFICIGESKFEKKIKELISVCTTIELPSPTNEQILTILKMLINKTNLYYDYDYYIKFCNNNLSKVALIYSLFKKDSDNFISLSNSIKENINLMYDPKYIVNSLYNNDYTFSDHERVIHETERTTVALIWHENISLLLNKLSFNKKIVLYNKILYNICFSDYIDRITFQKQIWQFNELSSLIKTFYNNYIIHENCKNKSVRYDSINFTKILTKYSTEYNNYNFINKLCNILLVDKSDLFNIFIIQINNNIDDNYYLNNLDDDNISKLDILRMAKYIKYLQ